MTEVVIFCHVVALSLGYSDQVHINLERIKACLYPFLVNQIDQSLFIAGEGQAGKRNPAAYRTSGLTWFDRLTGSIGCVGSVG